MHLLRRQIGVGPSVTVVKSVHFSVSVDEEIKSDKG